MAMTDTRSEAAAPAADGAAPAADSDSITDIFGNGDHKAVGRLWIVSSALFLLAGLVVNVIAGFEQSNLDGFEIAKDGDQFVQLWSLGRDLVMFGGLVPLIVGLALYVTPLQIGASALAFSRGAATAFWTWLVSTGILVLSYIMNGGPRGGRTDYVVLWALALAVMIGAIVWALVCLATTIVGARTAGMSLEKAPVSTWGFFLFAVVGILALPIVMGELLLAYLDVRYGYLPTDASRDTLLSVLDSVSIAPAIYWLGIPVLGIAVEAISVHTGKPVRFHRSAMAALGILAVYSFAGDFLSFAGRGRPISFDNGAYVLLIVLSAVPVLSVLGLAGESLKTGSVKVRTPLVAGMAGGLLLLAATGASVLTAVAPIVGFLNTNFDAGINLDSAWNLAGSSFHEGIRGLVVAAALLGVIAGVNHWGHKIWGRSVADRLGLLASLAAVGGGLVWGVPLIITGFLSPNRFSATGGVIEDGVEVLNLVSAIGTALVAGGAALLLLQILGASAGRGSAVEPWSGLTLEWATTSPPPVGNFASAPVVSSATPLADDHFDLALVRTGTAAPTVAESDDDAQPDDAVPADAEPAEVTAGGDA